MRAVVQRVNWAQVEVGRSVVARIERGLLVYVGVCTADGEADARWLGEKVANLRVFADNAGKLNVSVRDAAGGILAVSNFTLAGDARRGRRPSFTDAAPPAQAEPLHEAFVAAARSQHVAVETGVFGAEMLITSQADGPVNIILDSRHPDAPPPKETPRPQPTTSEPPIRPRASR